MDKPVKALLDTGSTVSIISEAFCKKNNISIPALATLREVTLADGTITSMKQWSHAVIELNPYCKVKCHVLISPSVQYDMLFGLNICAAINANIYPDGVRFALEIDGKERYGKLPLTRCKL